MFIVSSCKLHNIDDEDFAVIEGRVQRAIDETGIANQSVTLFTLNQSQRELLNRESLEQKTVTTDEDGNFSALMRSEAGAFVSAIYSGDEDFYGSGILRDYSIDEPIIINTDKYIKFKISVTNTDPFDENDFIEIDLYVPGHNVIRTGIENIGVDNTSEETSWTGTNVNSIVSYSVREIADEFKIRWRMVKNGIETTGYTDEIPYDVDQINSFSFDY